MTTTSKYLSFSITILLMAITAFGLFYTAHANPSFFIRKQLASATSTQTYFSAGGVSTTTLTFDTGVTSAQGADSAMLLLQFTSTSSQPTLKADIQYSQDSVDWYEIPMGWNNPMYASTTPDLGDVNSLTFLYASSTVSRGVSAGVTGSAATSTRVVQIPTPTRYVRAVFYETAGSGAGAIWAEFVGKRQSN